MTAPVKKPFSFEAYISKVDFGEQNSRNIPKKYKPTEDKDVTVISGEKTYITVKLQCITFMKEFEDKSLEELRLADYNAGRGAQGPLGKFLKKFNSREAPASNRKSPRKKTGAAIAYEVLSKRFETKLFKPKKRCGVGEQYSGTMLVKYSPPVVLETEQLSNNLNCITAMKEYENKSLEELRLEDYKAGRNLLTKYINDLNQTDPTTKPNLFVFGYKQQYAFSFRENENTDLVDEQNKGNALVKYSPTVGTDYVINKSGSTASISVKLNCITIMKEYENKSLEELRLEDYRAGRKPNKYTNLRFHTVHGDKIKVSDDRTTAERTTITERTTSHLDGVTFSSKPISVGKEIYLRLTGISKLCRVITRIHFGFTTENPSGIAHSVPKLATTTKNYWICQLKRNLSDKKDNILNFNVNTSGELRFGINGEIQDEVLTNIDISRPLWAVIDICGGCKKVQFVGPDELDRVRSTNQVLDGVRRTNQTQVEDVVRRTNQIQVEDVARRTNQSQVEDVARRPNQSQVEDVARRSNQSQVEDVARRTNQSQVEDVGRRTNQSQVEDVARPTNHSQDEDVARRTNQSQIEDVDRRTNQSQIEDPLVDQLRSLSVDPRQRDPAPLYLHRTKGKNIHFTGLGIAARCDGEYCQGYVFTARPMRVGQTITVQVLNVDENSPGSLAIGLTSCNPNTLKPHELPDDAEFLLDRPEYWIVYANAANGFGIGDELDVTLTTDGRLEISKKISESIAVLYVDHTLKLWAFFDVVGATKEVKLLVSEGVRRVSRGLDGIRRSDQGLDDFRRSEQGFDDFRRLNQDLRRPDQGLGEVRRSDQGQGDYRRFFNQDFTHSDQGLGEVRRSDQGLDDFRRSEQGLLEFRRFFQDLRRSDQGLEGVKQNRVPTTPSTSKNKPETSRAECTICFERKIDCVLYKCGHMCMCYDCAIKQWKNEGRSFGKCPICRAKIRDVIRTYTS